MDSLKGLSRLTALDTLEVKACYSLGSFSDLSNLTHLKALTIESCTALTSLEGLLNLGTKDMKISLLGCYALESLKGLSGQVGGTIEIRDCPTFCQRIARLHPNLAVEQHDCPPIHRWRYFDDGTDDRSIKDTILHDMLGNYATSEEKTEWAGFAQELETFLEQRFNSTPISVGGVYKDIIYDPEYGTWYRDVICTVFANEGDWHRIWSFQWTLPVANGGEKDSADFFLNFTSACSPVVLHSRNKTKEDCHRLKECTCKPVRTGA
jgi:hypothetical protein